MSLPLRHAWVLLLLAFALACALRLNADEYGAEINGIDPGVGRGVARISLLNGDVSVQRGDTADPVAAASNAPLLAQDALLTNSSSRAEIQFESGDAVRVGAATEVRLGPMGLGANQIQLALGTITFRVLSDSSRDEIQTPSVAIRPLRAGSYRITVREDGASEITVRAGQAEIASTRGAQTLDAGQTMLVRVNANEAEFQLLAGLQLDGWDRWNQERDRAFDNSRSQRLLGPTTPGAADLDANGRWLNDPTYGQVWTPTVTDANWAPYHDGSWTWEDWYGWTWVGAEPWGWAPYHYGRWFYGSAGWCWWPGPFNSPRYWSPALVGFFGFGGNVGFGLGFGFGHVGWVPLAPYEAFHPWWGRGIGAGGIFERTRIINNVNVLSAYRNARVPYGISGTTAGNFGRAGSRALSVNPAQLGNVGQVHGAPPITPDRSSLAFSGRAAQPARFTQGQSIPQQFVGGRRAPAVQRTPFQEQQRSLQNTTQQRFNGAFTGTRGALSDPAGNRGFGMPAQTPGTRAVSPFAPRQAATLGAFGSPQAGHTYAAPPVQERIRINPLIVHTRPAGSPGSFGVAPPAQSYRAQTPPAGAGSSFSAPRSSPPASSGAHFGGSGGGGSHAPSGGSHHR